MFMGRGDLLPDEVLARLEPPEEASAPHDCTTDGRWSILAGATKGVSLGAAGDTKTPTRRRELGSTTTAA